MALGSSQDNIGTKNPSTALDAPIAKPIAGTIKGPVSGVMKTANVLGFTLPT
jgi:hypothetical protein